MDSPYPVKRNEEIQVEIEKTAFGGKGISRKGDYVIFVSNTLPGDIVLARIYKRRPNYAEARTVRMIRPSGLRIEAPCPYFEWCGGCTWQNLSYENQLTIKKSHVIESLKHLADMQDVIVYDPLPSPKIWGYRNKMEFSFSDRRWLLPHELGDMEISRDYALGLHIPGTFDKILDVDFCFLQSDKANLVLKIVDHFAVQHRLQPYGIKSHEGFLRYLVIRESTYSGKILVNIVTAYEDRMALNQLAEQIISGIPEVSGVVNTINRGRAQIATGDEVFCLAGQDFIIEKMGDFEFRISSNSFFQTNTLQAEKLYKTVQEYARLDGQDQVWDLYCGTGTITLWLAEKAKFVTGFELTTSAVSDARENASYHDIHNVQFIAGDLTKQIKQAQSLPDVIVVDPPRAGMHPDVCTAVAEARAKRIVYVSCNPATLSRDLKILSEKYKTKQVQPLDMFPHTYHIESVVELEKK